ncbi:16S rRNA methyltransferase [Janibacter sp. Soil728]|uniref:16S rRNA (uracil(1498)-N(3))-methyltransferase n=1 Tax=Janibacter sp. Soil728 TaxID=1736393 RepID=UPI0006F47A01|nr:16S rRNA (uracil(1498)-N(3))-methyltransferase [Janibacter sp. Soil728]KRE37937.1 16S rRNA methyltransferase [Janibacter sp. Soil728]
MTAPLFLVDPGTLDGLGVDDVVDLTGPEAHHAATVVRLSVGEEVLVADRQGARALTTAQAVSGDLVRLRISSRADEPAPSLRLVLVQALSKDGRDEDAVEAATELGVDGIIPWQADRSIVRWKGPKADKGLRKWTNVIERAAKQSRRGRWPVLEGLESSSTLAQRCAQEGVTPFVLHEDATTPLATAALPSEGEVLLIVGPEGGISPQEVDRLVAAGATPVRLGSQVLRASTAGPAAIAVLSAETRWR